MALSRTQGSTAISSQSVAAGGSVQSSTLTLGSTAISYNFYGRMTNGGTGPTIPMLVKLQVSPDNTNWYDTGIQASGSPTASAVVDFNFSAPSEGYAYRINAGSNTGQAVTVVVFYDTVTSYT